MRYIISNNVALRSWKLVPCAFYVRGHQYAQRLSREQFELLKRCDGVQELEQTEPLRLLERAGVVREARPGETWSEWSSVAPAPSRAVMSALISVRSSKSPAGGRRRTTASEAVRS